MSHWIKSRTTLILIILIIIGFFIRIIPAYIFYGTGDVTSDSEIAQSFLQGKDLYRETIYNHYPVLIYLWVFAEIAEHYSNIGVHFWQKLPSVLSDLGIIYLIYLIILKLRKNKKEALIGASLYIFNPVVILITSFHGQYESLLMLIILIILYLFHFYNWASISKKVLLLSFLGIIIKGWVILTPIVIAFHIKSKNESIKFILYLGIILFAVTVPLIYIYGNSFVNNVFAYFPAGDHGLGAVFEHFPSFFTKNPMLFIKELFFINDGILPKIIIISVLFLALVKGRKMNIFNSMLFVYLVIFSTSTGLGSQYLMWAIPLAIIVRDRLVIPYSFIASLAIIVFYLDRYTSAFTPTIYHNFFSIGSLPVSYGKMIFILWLFCIFWMFKKFQEKT